MKSIRWYWASMTTWFMLLLGMVLFSTTVRAGAQLGDWVDRPPLNYPAHLDPKETTAHLVRLFESERWKVTRINAQTYELSRQPDFLQDTLTVTFTINTRYHYEYRLAFKSYTTWSNRPADTKPLMAHNTYQSMMADLMRQIERLIKRDYQRNWDHRR